MTSQDIRAEETAVREITDYLLVKLDEYLADHESRQIDIFMAAHNFHRFIVSDLAKKWEPSIPADKTLRMADLTFRNTMRYLRRST